MRKSLFEAREKVGHRVLGFNDLGPADVYAERNSWVCAARAQTIQSERDSVCAFIVETEPVYQCIVFLQAIESRFRIARLPLRRNGADFHEPETKTRNHLGRQGVFVETARETHWVGKCQRTQFGN